MKKLLALTGIVSAMAILAIVAGCQTAAVNQSEIATSKKENLPAQAGFKVKTVTHPKPQQEQQMLQGSPVWTGETAGPRHVDVQVFDGFGPLNPMQGTESS